MKLVFFVCLLSFVNSGCDEDIFNLVTGGNSEVAGFAEVSFQTATNIGMVVAPPAQGVVFGGMQALRDGINKVLGIQNGDCKLKRMFKWFAENFVSKKAFEQFKRDLDARLQDVFTKLEEIDRLEAARGLQGYIHMTGDNIKTLIDKSADYINNGITFVDKMWYLARSDYNRPMTDDAAKKRLLAFLGIICDDISNTNTVAQNLFMIAEECGNDGTCDKQYMATAGYYLLTYSTKLLLWQSEFKLFRDQLVLWRGSLRHFKYANDGNYGDLGNAAYEVDAKRRCDQVKGLPYRKHSCRIARNYDCANNFKCGYHDQLFQDPDTIMWGRTYCVSLKVTQEWRNPWHQCFSKWLKKMYNKNFDEQEYCLNRFKDDFVHRTAEQMCTSSENQYPLKMARTNEKYHFWLDLVKLYYSTFLMFDGEHKDAWFKEFVRPYKWNSKFNSIKLKYVDDELYLRGCRLCHQAGYDLKPICIKMCRDSSDWTNLGSWTQVHTFWSVPFTTFNRKFKPKCREGEYLSCEKKSDSGRRLLDDEENVSETIEIPIERIEDFMDFETFSIWDQKMHGEEQDLIDSDDANSSDDANISDDTNASDDRNTYDKADSDKGSTRRLLN